MEHKKCTSPNDHSDPDNSGQCIYCNALSTHEDACAIDGWTETKSTLVVSNKAGAKYPSPQALLDRLVGRLAFDPLAFKDDKDQAKTLRELVKLDVSAFEQARAKAASERQMLKKTLGIKQAQMLALPHHEGVPAQEVSLDGVSQKMLAAESYRKLADDADRAIEKCQSNVDVFKHDATRHEEQVADLLRRLEVVRASLRSVEDSLKGELLELDALKITAQSARAVVPDVGAIRKELAETEATNAKVRANQKHESANQEVGHLEKQIEEADDAVKLADRLTEGRSPAHRAVPRRGPWAVGRGRDVRRSAAVAGIERGAAARLGRDRPRPQPVAQGTVGQERQRARRRFAGARREAGGRCGCSAVDRVGWEGQECGAGVYRGRGGGRVKMHLTVYYADRSSESIEFESDTHPESIAAALACKAEAEKTGKRVSRVCQTIEVRGVSMDTLLWRI